MDKQFGNKAFRIFILHFKFDAFDQFHLLFCCKQVSKTSSKTFERVVRTERTSDLHSTSYVNNCSRAHDVVVMLNQRH